MKFRILRFKKLRSTNDTAIRMVKSSNLNYGMIIADSQSNGRGQYGRKWISFKGNLFVSFFYNLENMDLNLTKITKLNCILVKKLISKYYKKRIVYKKPNDLLIKGKKICGILQEIINKQNQKFLILGIGINLIKNPIISDYPTTNLNDLINKKISKRNIEIQLKKIFEKNLEIYKHKKINGNPSLNTETPNKGIEIKTAGIKPIRVLIIAVKVNAAIISLILIGAINKLVKFLLHISSRNIILKLILALNKKSYKIAAVSITPTVLL